MSDMPQRPYTHVSLRLAGGNNLLSAVEYEALPVSERMAAILEKKATFIKDSTIVPISDILEYLRALRKARQ